MDLNSHDPEDTLFNSSTTKGPSSTIYIVVIAAFLLFGGVGYGLYRYTAPAPPDMSAIRSAEIKETMVFLLAQPSFSGDEFREQLLGRGRIAKYAWKEKQVYFTYPEASEEEFQAFLSKHIADVSKVDFGKTVNGTIRLDDYELRPGPAAAKFFKTATDNFRLETDRDISIPFSAVNYSASLGELRELATSAQLYGGKMITKAPSRKDEPQMVFANHGIMVAKPGEPSLKRLVDSLLKDVGDNREARIQRLVDFVSSEIEYSFTEAVAPSEKLKRPSETLMTRNGDCSNKTILLASLLEQIGEEYRLLYCPLHITVAIPQGNYANDNKLDFTWDGKPWLIAETTVAGFQIGQTRVTEPNRLTSVQYVQNPKLPEVIFDAESFEVLKFF
ncbi:MAG: hypothetical protein QUS14_17795 [Pyrinomonadaceae bacterium]|nr:hypothetical protein [Pyrinomonadaceae bacterium]